MKNRITLFAVLTALVLSLTAFVQLSKKEMATGKWQMTSFKMDSNPAEIFIQQMPEEARAQMLEKYEAEMKEACKKSHLTLSEDGKYVFLMSLGKTPKEEKGSWSLSKDGKTITFMADDSEEEEEEVMNVLELSNNVLSLEVTQEEGGTSMTISMEFKK